MKREYKELSKSKRKEENNKWKRAVEGNKKKCGKLWTKKEKRKKKIIEDIEMRTWKKYFNEGEVERVERRKKKKEDK